MADIFGNDGNTLGDDILDDEDIFDHEVFDDDDDEIITKQPTLIKEEEEQRKQQKDEEKKEEKSQESRDKRAFDKIKEYLHLSASAVKIKYPTVRNIQSDELIKRVRELPFY